MRGIREYLGKHPFLATWLALAVGMAVILLVAMRGKEFTLAQNGAMVLGAVALAAAAAWLIGQGEE